MIKNTCAAIEAVLFAAGEPMDVQRIAQAIECDEDTVLKLINLMIEQYEAEERGIMIVELNRTYQMCTKIQYAQYIKTALDIRRNTPLSQAAMEILAIIAYNQPVTKSFVEQIRGVDSSQAVNNLVEKGLVEEAGRLDVPGRPIAYKTTANFLRTFGLKNLEGLPPLPDDSGQVMLDEVVNGDNESNQSRQDDSE